MTERRRASALAVCQPLIAALAIALTTSCPPALPATRCAADSECPSCHRCDAEHGFCYRTDTCAGGTCRAETCCTGCWAGAQCQPGDVETACGVGGNACTVCASGTGCSDGRCGAAPASDLALGTEVSCALRGDGAVWCLGDASGYALGSDASGGATAYPQQVLVEDEDLSLGPVESLAGRGDTLCAVRADGQAWCWGAGRYGQLGAGDLSSHVRAVPVQDPRGDALREVTQVSVGGAHACARSVDGGVWCWGNNDYGQLGQGDTITGTFTHAVPVLDASGTPLHDVEQVACGSWHTCVRTRGGSVLCTGGNSSGQAGVGHYDPLAVPGAVQLEEGGALGDVVEIACGSAHTCARLLDGTLRCWGYGSYGELGDGRGLAHPLATEVPELTTVTGLALGNNHSCALLVDGTARCWGANGAGALGDGTLLQRLDPVEVYTQGTAAHGQLMRLAAGSAHSCGLLKDGSIWCWGENNHGQLGLDAEAQPTVLAPHAGPRLPAAACEPVAATTVTAAVNHACALLVDGTAWCWGDNTSGQLGAGLTGGLRWRPQPVLQRIAGLASAQFTGLATSRAEDFACALAGDATAWCWGSDYQGRLGDGGTEHNQPVPVQVTTRALEPLRAVRNVSLGDGHACASVDDRVRSVWCWGGDRYQSLGNGPDADHQPRAAEVRIDASTTLVHVAEVHAGVYHACARLNGGQVWCWGHGDDGRLGTASNAQEPFARQLLLATGHPLDDATMLVVGHAHGCVVRADGSAWCWGRNSSGQLGDGSTTQRDSPVRVEGALGPIAALTAGTAHTCALLQDRRAWCWGDNAYGQLGDGSAVNSSVPVQVERAADQILEPVTSLSAGDAFTCAVDGAGALLCWGTNSLAQLGQPRSLPLTSVPMRVAVGCR